jgi:hypothetical protein
VYCNLAVGVATARTTGRGGGLEQFVAWQDRISSLTGNPLAGRIQVVAELPASASPDELFVVGDCDALYLSTGDLYEPWVTVQARDLVIVVRADRAGVRAGALTAVTLGGAVRRQIVIETNDRSEVRLRIESGSLRLTTDWQPFPGGSEIELRLVGDTAYDAFEVRFGDYVGAVPLAEWNRNWDMIVADVSIDLAPADMQTWTGVHLSHVPGPVPELCNRLRDRVDD